MSTDLFCQPFKILASFHKKYFYTFIIQYGKSYIFKGDNFVVTFKPKDISKVFLYFFFLDF